MENNTETTGAPAPPPREYPAVDAFCLGIKKALRSVEPSPEVKQHFRNARLEVLKGLRQIIDNRIQCLDRANQHGRKLTVE